MSDFFRSVGSGLLRSSGGLLAPHYSLQGWSASVAAAGTVTPELGNATYFSIGATGDFTIANPLAPKLPTIQEAGLGTGPMARVIAVQVISGAGVGITITWGTQWHFNGAWPVLGAGLAFTSLWLLIWANSGAKLLYLIGRDNDQP